MPDQAEGLREMMREMKEGEPKEIVAEPALDVAVDSLVRDAMADVMIRLVRSTNMTNLEAGRRTHEALKRVFPGWFKTIPMIVVIPGLNLIFG